jgi:hypothetical protein
VKLHACGPPPGHSSSTRCSPAVTSESTTSARRGGHARSVLIAQRSVTSSPSSRDAQALLRPATLELEDGDDGGASGQCPSVRGARGDPIPVSRNEGPVRGERARPFVQAMTGRPYDAPVRAVERGPGAHVVRSAERKEHLAVRRWVGGGMLVALELRGGPQRAPVRLVLLDGDGIAHPLLRPVLDHRLARLRHALHVQPSREGGSCEGEADHGAEKRPERPLQARPPPVHVRTPAHWRAGVLPGL